MKTAMKFYVTLIVSAFFVSPIQYALAQGKVDQGRPGNQGPWPVSITGPISSTGIVTGPDGGAVIVQGTVIVIGPDGGVVQINGSVFGPDGGAVNVQGGPVIVVGPDGGAIIVTSSAGSVGPDGGAVVTQPAQCAATLPDGGTPYKSTVCGVASVPVPVVATANRLYEEVCNSLQNSGNPFAKCRADGVVPVMAVTNPGDMLGIGDCIRYYTPASTVTNCICDTASVNLTSYECVPTR